MNAPVRASRVLAYGDNTTDFFVDRGLAYPGGNCVNFAVFASRLGMTATYLGPFGSDIRAGQLREALAQENVEISKFSTTNEGATGLAKVLVRDGDVTGAGLNGGGVGSTHPVRVTDEIVRYIGEFDLLHSSVYSHLESDFERMSTAGVLAAFDFSSEPEYRRDGYLSLVAPFVDWAQFSGTGMSASDARMLARHLHERFAVPIVVITRGSSDIVVQVDGVAATVPITPVDEGLPFVDTLGCGDALFAAGVVGLLSRGWSKGHPATLTEVVAALTSATSYSAKQCGVEAGFGHGYAMSYDDEVAKL